MRKRSKRRRQADERIAVANIIIRAISNHGRRFFFHADRVSSFARSHTTGLIQYRDKYSDKITHTQSPSHTWRISEGGTLKELIGRLHRFIVHGETFNLCFRHWAYSPDAVKAVCEEITAKTVGLVQEVYVDCRSEGNEFIQVIPL